MTSETSYFPGTEVELIQESANERGALSYLMEKCTGGSHTFGWSRGTVSVLQAMPDRRACTSAAGQSLPTGHRRTGIAHVDISFM